MTPSLKTIQSAAAALVVSAAINNLYASENVPHAFFGEWAEVAKRGELITRLTYQESEAYYIWAGNKRYKTDWRQNGEHYGIDINQAYLTFQYGLNDRWTADLSIGFTSSGWRYFSNESANGASQSTSGLMDISFGVRYQIFKEGEDESRPWLPTLTFRAGAVLPGSFDEHFPFSPGTSSTAIEPELIARKHFGWEGFGAYADALFRWNHTSANDQYIIALGLFQKIQRWELNVGYRRLHSVDGDEIIFNPGPGPDDRDITYPRAPREIQDSIEAGFSYRAKRWDTRMGFMTRTVFDGRNTDKKFWLGGYVEIPFQLTGDKQ